MMASFPLSWPLVLALVASGAAQLTKFLVALGKDGTAVHLPANSDAIEVEELL